MFILPRLGLLLATFASHATAMPAPSSEARSTRNHSRGAFFLAGDSTTAQQSSGGGGWGNGFLTTIKNGSFGMNYGHNGATTASFVAGGDWARVLGQVTKAKGLAYEPYVTIQFGHNDQKTTSGINITQFAANLKKMASDVVIAGGTPILVTSITRRTFNSSGLAIEDLAPQANATISVAKSNGFHYIDLNRASTDYVDSIGANLSATYNLIPTDFTHLNAHASIVFGNMVAELVKDGRGKGGQFVAGNETILRAIEKGRYIFPDLPVGEWVNSTAPAGFSY